MKAFTKISAKDRHRKENFQGYLFITPAFFILCDIYCITGNNNFILSWVY